jgi:hypothetical protein
MTNRLRSQLDESSVAGHFHRTSLKEHFRVGGRRTWIETIVKMQAVLDDYLEGYNTRRPNQGYGLNGGTPIRSFTEGLPKSHTKGGNRTGKIHQTQSRLMTQPNKAPVRGIPSLYRS